MNQQYSHRSPVSSLDLTTSFASKHQACSQLHPRPHASSALLASTPDSTSAIPDQFIRRPTVCQITSLPSSSLTDLISKNQFPKPFKLSERMSAWKLSEVMEWMNTRERAA